MTKGEQRKTSEDSSTADAEGTLTPEMLVRKHASAVLGVCIAHTKNFHDSEDIMQDVFLKAFKKLHTLRDHSRVRWWLLQIARRMCVDYYRSAQTRQSIPNDRAAPEGGRKENIERLYRAISKLPDGYREPIVLYYLDGRKCSNVARCLGISEDAVRSRLCRGRLRLHDLLLEDKS